MENQVGTISSPRNDSITQRIFNEMTLKRPSLIGTLPNLQSDLSLITISPYYIFQREYYKFLKTKLTKLIEMLRYLFGFEIIDTIHIYGPEPFLLNETIRQHIHEGNLKSDTLSLGNSEKLGQLMIHPNVKKNYDKIFHSLPKFDCLKIWIEDLPNTAFNLDPIINLSWDCSMERMKASKYPRIIWLWEYDRPVVLYSIGRNILRHIRNGFSPKQRKKQKFRTKVPQAVRMCDEKCISIKVSLPIEGLKNTPSNVLIVLNTISLYNNIFNLTPTISDLCYADCSWYHYNYRHLSEKTGLTYSEIHSLHNALHRNSLTIDEILSYDFVQRNFSHEEEQELRMYCELLTISEAISHLENIGDPLNLSYKLRKINNILLEINKGESKEIIDYIIKDYEEYLYHIQDNDFILIKNNLVYLKCSYVDMQLENCRKVVPIMKTQEWMPYIEALRNTIKYDFYQPC